LRARHSERHSTCDEQVRDVSQDDFSL
jgi:hypothetical protein